MRIFAVTLVSLLSVTALGAVAQQMPSDQLSPPQAAVATAPDQPRMQTQGNISFVSGGVSDEGRSALDQLKGSSNLRLLFAVKGSGEYLSAIGVTLADAKGQTVLDTTSNGPLFYAHVPPGHYRITVANDGQNQTRDVTISAAGAQSLDFYWPAAS